MRGQGGGRGGVCAAGGRHRARARGAAGCVGLVMHAPAGFWAPGGACAAAAMAVALMRCGPVVARAEAVVDFALPAIAAAPAPSAPLDA